jgi:hypothetical protein
MSMSINDGAADTVTAVSTIDIVSGGSVVVGGIEILGASPGQTTSDQTPIDPFAVVNILDANVGVVDTVTVTMSNTANGTFSDVVGGTVNGGTFTVTGTPDPTQFGLIANVDSALAGLVFTPTRGQVPLGQSVTTAFTITASNTLGSVTDASSSVIATDLGGQLSINGAQANQEAASDTTLLPLAGVTITDTQATPVDTVTVTLSNPAVGVLSAGDGGTVGADGVFRVSGPLAQAQAALQAVAFTPAAAILGNVGNSGLTISVADGTLNATNSITSVDVIGTMPCFAAGTRIMTRHGEVPVELLREGDVVVTAAGASRPIQWIGHRRIDCRRHAKPHDVWPVRVHVGAFGAGLPRRELWLSPDHAVFIDNVLIPVRYLINGRTIVQTRVAEVTYYHLEISTHDVILAEHLPCESYLDTGNRSDFANGGSAIKLHPTFARGVWAASACAELVLDGTRLETARSRLLEQAGILGHGITDDPGLAVIVDGHVAHAEIDGRTWRVRLPPAARSVRLKSSTWIPAQTRANEQDTRSLGVAIGNLRLNGEKIGLDDPRLSSGWHAAEPADSEDAAANWRWTDGDAGLALAGVRELAFDVAITGSYWKAPRRSVRLRSR